MPTSSSSRPGSLRRAAMAILGYGVVCGLLIAALRFMEYRFLVLEQSRELYGGLIAALFAGLGIALGRRLVRKAETPKAGITSVAAATQPPTAARPQLTSVGADDSRRRQLGITPRELEILGWIAAGLSNREIADRLCVSENTVKTHSSRVFDKLGARRRTQAVQRGKELGLIP